MESIPKEQRIDFEYKGRELVAEYDIKIANAKKKRGGKFGGVNPFLAECEVTDAITGEKIELTAKMRRAILSAINADRKSIPLFLNEKDAHNSPALKTPSTKQILHEAINDLNMNDQELNELGLFEYQGKYYEK
jgi:hypothetical protein